jgi:protein arginine kinase activator
MFNGKCVKCGQAATFKFTRVENGQAVDLYFCPQHAIEASPYQKQPTLGDILEGLFKQDAEAEGVAEGPQCPVCGLAFSSYRKNFMLGCDRCYEAFGDALLRDLRKLHGATRHVGRRPGGGKIRLSEGEAAMPIRAATEASPATASELSRQRVQEMIAELQQKLNLALEREDFEKAARYRDLLKEFQDKS